MPYDKLKNLVARFWHWPVILILAVAFFIGTSSFNYYLQKENFVKWISPDETANYTFAKLYAQEKELSIYEKYNLYAKDIIHPRSFRSDLGNMKPISFLGLPIIFGSIASLSTYKILPYLTPLFGAIGLIYFYLLIKKLFGRNNALISAFLLASFPVYTYYSARSMFHNILFVALLIVGLYYIVLMGNKNKSGELRTNFFEFKRINFLGMIFAALAGIFTAGALMARTSEIIWVAPMLFILWLFNIRQVGIAKLLIFISFLLFAFLPTFYWNTILYGSPLSGGYPEMNKSISNVQAAGTDMAKTTMAKNAYAEKTKQMKEAAKKIKDNVFYFGFNAKQSGKMIIKYFPFMFSWIFWPAIAGFALFLFNYKKLRKKHYAFLFSYFLISLILIFYYGSWKFNDNPDPSSVTIGNSYTRYWLPIYLGALPFVSILIMAVTDYNKKAEHDKKINFHLKSMATFLSRLALISLISFISINFVLSGSEEGLLPTFKKQTASKAELEKVLKLTEKNAAIITRYHDKLFFPERKVIFGLFNDPNMNLEYAALNKKIPVYYYNFTFPDKDFQYLNRTRLAAAGIGIRAVGSINGFTLYRVYSVGKK